jgi:hypothetical protein
MFACSHPQLCGALRPQSLPIELPWERPPTEGRGEGQSTLDACVQPVAVEFLLLLFFAQTKEKKEERQSAPRTQLPKESVTRFLQCSTNSPASTFVEAGLFAEHLFLIIVIYKPIVVFLDDLVHLVGAYGVVPV